MTHHVWDDSIMPWVTLKWRLWPVWLWVLKIQSLYWQPTSFWPQKRAFCESTYSLTPRRRCSVGPSPSPPPFCRCCCCRRCRWRIKAFPRQIPYLPPSPEFSQISSSASNFQQQKVERENGRFPSLLSLPPPQKNKGRLLTLEEVTSIWRDRETSIFEAAFSSSSQNWGCWTKGRQTQLSDKSLRVFFFSMRGRKDLIWDETDFFLPKILLQTWSFKASNDRSHSALRC